MISFQNDLTLEVSAAKTIFVPSNYTLIQAAIDNATPDDTIYVWAGIYHENVVVNKTVTIIGNGSEDTVIDGGGVGDVVKITANWVNFSGFEIINSGNKWVESTADIDVGIELNNVQNVTISNNNCYDNNRTGIFLFHSNSNTIINNTNNFIGNISGGYGVQLWVSNFNKIINNTCIDNYVGIRIEYSTYNTIYNNNCSFNSGHGIYIGSASFNEMYNNTYYHNGLCGIYLDESTFNHILNNYCTSNGYHGIFLKLGSDSNIVRNNNCSFNSYAGIFVNRSCFNTVENNSCLENSGAGITLRIESNFNTISNNLCRSNMLGFYILRNDANTLRNNTISSNSYCGLQLGYITSIKFFENKITDSSIYFFGDKLEHFNSHTIDTSNTYSNKPIYYWKDRSGGEIPLDAGQIILANCTNVQVKNQAFINGWNPIHLFYSSFNNVSDNSFLNNAVHNIVLDYCDQNIIENNTCINATYNGLSLRYSNNNLIINNTVISNELDGIFLNHSSSNIISYNDFTSNKEAGLMLRNSKSNMIFFNNIIDNIVQAVEMDNSKNEWDNGNGEGNYWSDYTGVDNGADGRMAGDCIGDTAIPHQNLDYFPFVNKSGWYHAGKPILFDPGDYDSNGSFYITWYPARGAIQYVLEEDDNLDFDSPITIYNEPEVRTYVTGRKNGTYYYQLKAIGEESDSPWSNVVDMIVDWPPVKPKNLTVAVFPEGNALNISWDSSVEDVKTFELYYKTEKMSKWNQLTTMVYPENKYDHMSLIDGIKYEYKVQAIDGRGQISEFSDIKSGIPKDSVAPSAPTGLSIVEVTNDSIKLTWEPNPDVDIEGYNIYQFTIAVPGSWGELRGTIEAGNEEFFDKDLSELTTYYYVINAFDEVFNNSTYSEVVFGGTKLGPHGPEINQSIQNFSIYEDSIETSRINLYHWFRDINNDPLEFWCEGDKYINVTIFQNNGTVILSPINNWYGIEILVFYASDGYDKVFDNITVTVLPVNDPPNKPSIIEPKSQLEIDFGTLLDFMGECTDPDLLEDELTFKWTSDIQGELGIGVELIEVELIPGVHNITLMVYDENGSSSTENVIIIVLKNEPLPNKDNEITRIMGIIAGITIIIMLILIIFVFLIKKRQDKSTRLASSEPASSRFSFLSLRVSDSSNQEDGKLVPQTINRQTKQQSIPLPHQKMEPTKTKDQKK